MATLNNVVKETVVRVRLVGFMLFRPSLHWLKICTVLSLFGQIVHVPVPLNVNLIREILFAGLCDKGLFKMILRSFFIFFDICK